MRRILVGLAAAFCIACDDGIVGTSHISGDYELKTINGVSLPYTMSGSGANKTEVLDRVITLYNGGTYSESGHLRVTVNGQATTQDITGSGSYSFFGTAITLLSSDGRYERRGLFNEKAITIIEEGLSQVFSK
ncbi:MAG TPA: hypothetical protein VGC52_01690 [Gemmatimonadaceae bacterium]